MIEGIFIDITVVFAIFLTFEEVDASSMNNI